MQDRYAGDIGDYGKFGLLRWLCGMRQLTGPALRLGVVWHLFHDDGAPNGNNDGCFTEYLCRPSGTERTLEDCDPDLL